MLTLRRRFSRLRWIRRQTAIWRFRLDNPYFQTHEDEFPWVLFGTDERDPPIGTLEDIGNGLIRSITRNVVTGEIVVEEYKGDLNLL